MADLSTMIVDMLRNKEENRILNQGGPLAKAPASPAASEAANGAQALANPAYVLYKREALANGEPVMSPEEFKQAQGAQ